MVWNLKETMDHPHLVFIGIAYLFIGILDLLHTLSYKGMNIFTDYDYYANQLWIAARYMESLSILASLLLLKFKKTISYKWALIVYSIITTLLVASIFWWKIFPICYIDGVGLTAFKKISEYIISGILIVDTFLLIKLKENYPERIYKFLLLAIIFTILSEIAFTFYVSNYGISNLIGHYFKIISFYFIYKAILQHSLREPYTILYKKLKDSEENYRNLYDELNEKNRELRDYQKKIIVQEKLASLGALTAGIAHEIKNPLNFVMNFAELNRDQVHEIRDRLDELEVERKSDLTVINELLNNTENIIDRTLKYGKDINQVVSSMMEHSQNTESESIELDINNTTHHYFNIAYHNARMKYRDLLVHTEFDLDESLKKVFLSESGLSRLLINLFNNAFDAVNEKKKIASENYIPRIVIETHNRKDHLEIRIKDNGVGIPENIQNQIFNPFFTTKSPGNGHTGLGLSISFEIIHDVFKGNIHLNSFEKLFTEFILELPFTENPISEQA